MAEKPRLDTYGTQDMQLPEIRLIQRIGGDYAKELGAKPGQFFNTITEEIIDELEVVVVDILSGRVRWGEDIVSMAPLCFSLDADSMRSVNGDDCSTCPYRLDTPWTVEPGERRKRCNKNYTILAINLSDQTPLVIRCHGVSAKPARELITQLRLNRALHGEYYRAIVKFRSQERQTPFGSVFAIKPKITGLIADEERAKELKLQSQQLLGAPIELPEGRPEDEIAELPVATEAAGEQEKQPTPKAPAQAPDAVQMDYQELWDV